ncbi:MAG: hypothetical protein ACKVP7_23855 [Hyphomicrobiaceae bacterium]
MAAFHAAHNKKRTIILFQEFMAMSRQPTLVAAAAGVHKDLKIDQQINGLKTGADVRRAAMPQH